MNKKGFTLIELLAVIIILGILMIIAIPSVTSYINNSRKSAYVNTAKEIVSGARNEVNDGKLEMYSTDTTYYIPSGYIKTENASKSPYGEFVYAYVGVIYDGTGYKYYWISVDETKQGVKDIVAYDKLDEDDIVSGINPDEINTTVHTTGIGNRTKIKILEKNGNWLPEIELSDTSNNVSENGGSPSGSGSGGSGSEGSGGDTSPSPISYEGKERSELVAGDPVKIGDEEFYVINNDTTSDEVTLLARYNLNVGNNKKSGATEGIQDSEVKGWVSSGTQYGNIAFSSTNYWDGKVGEGLEYPNDYCEFSWRTNCTYVYYNKNKQFDSSNTIHQYVDAYKVYLENLGASIKVARLMSLEESYSFKSVNQVAWQETSYWLGSAQNYTFLWDLRSDGTYGGSNYNLGSYFGVRPVIVI